MDRYNPLDKRNLGTSVANALLRLEPVPLPAPGSTIRSGFVGAGVYAIYSTGEHQPFPPYARRADANRGSDGGRGLIHSGRGKAGGSYWTDDPSAFKRRPDGQRQVLRERDRHRVTDLPHCLSPGSGEVIAVGKGLRAG